MGSICFIQFAAFKVGENSLLSEILILSANWKLSLIFSN
jgi:hypothetical protein